MMMLMIIYISLSYLKMISSTVSTKLRTLMLQGHNKKCFFLTKYSQILVNLKPQVDLHLINRFMYTQIGKSHYLLIKIMPFTKRYFVIGKKLF